VERREAGLRQGNNFDTETPYAIQTTIVKGLYSRRLFLFLIWGNDTIAVQAGIPLTCMNRNQETARGGGLMFDPPDFAREDLARGRIVQ
jgi:hypothetical protein